MKTKIFIFSSLLCICGAFGARASDCTGPDCDIQPLVFEEFEWTQEQPTAIVVAMPTPVAPQATWMESDPKVAQMPATTVPVVPQYAEPVQMIADDQIPMRTVKMLSIKPVPEDTRPALWDGVHGQYVGANTDKTVDWRDGVPIWDESINSYKYKDFSDWYLKPTPEIYVREISHEEAETIDPAELYKLNMEDAAATRARVEELLAPQKPSGNLWFTKTESESDTVDVKLKPATVDERVAAFTQKKQQIVEPKPEYTAQDMTAVVEETFGFDDGCPFESETECAIWRRKPIVRETVSPRSKKLRDINMAEFVDVAYCNKDIDASHPVAAPLLNRYKMLMRSAQACCTDGMAYALKQAGASDGLVYKFLSDDANFYGFGARCLMMTDHDLDTKYPNTATAVVAADVRNGCLCRGRQWFNAMLAPFQQAYDALPEFKDAKFNYTYKDGLQRTITVSINNDVQNVLKQLEQCP
ncbi:MAG: hypothetical protein J6R52_00070 [Alphaproteobacteria bacterium]|nr:hypothetical protein [Alphaproteobacteria bacterium]